MATRRRIDGLSDDLLSYSVASDFDKQIGQALAEQEARLKDPRFVPGARVEQPDAPDILQRELIDPVLTAFGMRTSEDRNRRKTESAVPFQFTKLKDGSVGAFDKRTGSFDIVRPASPADSLPDNAAEIKNWYATSPTMRAEEAEALRKLSVPGADAFDVLGVEHPTLIRYPGYAERFGPIYREAQRKRMRDDNSPIVDVSPNVSSAIYERSRLSRALDAGELPDLVSGAISNRISEIDSSLAPTTDSVGDNEELVSVINPKGRPVRIRKSQLEAALKAKYRLR